MNRMKNRNRESIDVHDKGLGFDLQTVVRMQRRQMLRLIAGAGLIPIIGCGDDTMSSLVDSGTSNRDSSTGSDASTGSCLVIPEETEGPYPGDGSNGPNALTTSGIMRSDIRSSFATLSGTAEGVPLTIRLTLVDTAASCAPLAGYAIYLWHCDRDGEYSLYTVTNQNYLRGVQETDSNGQVTFTSIFPGCYAGRWPHAHFEIYPSLASVTSAGNNVKTSQLALPQDVCSDAYEADGYEQSVTNLAGVSLSSDGIFNDGYSQQMASVTGNATDGYVATLTVGIAT